MNLKPVFNSGMLLSNNDYVECSVHVYLNTVLIQSKKRNVVVTRGLLF